MIECFGRVLPPVRAAPRERWPVISVRAQAFAAARAAPAPRPTPAVRAQASAEALLSFFILLSLLLILLAAAPLSLRAGSGWSGDAEQKRLAIHAVNLGVLFVDGGTLVLGPSLNALNLTSRFGELTTPNTPSPISTPTIAPISPALAGGARVEYGRRTEQPE